jgi:hypothetical protein
MNVSHLLPGAPRPRGRLTPSAGLGSLEPAAARRWRIALLCLLAGYTLAWIELLLAFPVSPGETARIAASPLVAAVLARILLGVLYLLVALRRAWARWTVVALGFLSAFCVTPMLPGEWNVFPLAALVTGSGVVCKLAAAVLLMLPTRVRRVSPSGHS